MDCVYEGTSCEGCDGIAPAGQECPMKGLLDSLDKSFGKEFASELVKQGRRVTPFV